MLLLSQRDLFEKFTYLYSRYYYCYLNDELFLHTYLELNGLKFIEQGSLNLLTKDCYLIVNKIKKKFDLEGKMSTFNVNTNDNANDLYTMLEELIPQISEISYEEYEPTDALATKDDLQQLKRFTYKSFQNIQDSIESGNSSEEMKKEIELVKAEALENQFTMAKSAVELFNLFDRVRMTFAEDKNPLNSEQLTIVIEHSLTTLSTMGIEKIAVYGQAFNGDYMESLGTVSSVEENENLKPYEVAQVFRSAFRFQGNGKIIQTALVKTLI